MKRGDIYLVSLNPAAGHEQSGNRPVLVRTLAPQSSEPIDSVEL